MGTSPGIFSIPEFQGRNVIKLAPDAFIAINCELGVRFVSPVKSDSNSDGYKSLDVGGGISSINISAAVSPPGSSRANIEVIAPVYKGLHEDYYYTLPNGTRKSIFQPMMEVKVFFKGLYLIGGNPIYYPVFWGFITNISENYSNGVHTFSIVCSDMLSWWKYQKLTLIPSATSTATDVRLTAKKFPTLFENMNPWQIIYNLVQQARWQDETGAAYDFIYTKLSNTGRPEFGDLLKSEEDVGKFFKGLAENNNQYWQRRFGVNRNSPQADINRMPFEMFGLLNKIDLNDAAIKSALSYNNSSKGYQTITQIPQLDINFYLLSQVQPYGAFNTYSGGAEALENTKLDIATEVCAQTDMEFFLDTNSSVVFKPPFYNLDISDNEIYTVRAKDVINFSGDVNTDAICTYLEVFGPRYQFDPEIDSVGYHFDFDLMRKFGLRYQKLNLRYGNNAAQLRLLAAAKMSKINGRAFTGSVSIPLRPEIRLGYPIYISHIDAYYYVTGISHSFSYGGSATTSLSLEYRRDRVFSDGSVSGTKAGDVLKGYVYRYGAEGNSAEDFYIEDSQRVSLREDNINKTLFGTDISRDIVENDILKTEYLNEGGVISGPKSSGFYGISKARSYTRYVTPGPVINQESMDFKTEIVSNEMVMVSFPLDAKNRDATEETYPYTDINGYRHIGAFPYGANLSLVGDESKLVEKNNPREILDRRAKSLNDKNSRYSSTDKNQASTNSYSSKGGLNVEGVTNGTDQPELAIDLYNRQVGIVSEANDKISSKNSPKGDVQVKSPLRAPDTVLGTEAQADILIMGKPEQWV